MSNEEIVQIVDEVSQTKNLKLNIINNSRNYIDDNNTSIDKTWSSSKIQNIVNNINIPDLTAVLDDNNTSTDKTWSSSKIQTELTTINDKLGNVSIDDSKYVKYIDGVTYTPSLSLEYKLDYSNLQLPKDKSPILAMVSEDEERLLTVNYYSGTGKLSNSIVGNLNIQIYAKTVAGEGNNNTNNYTHLLTSTDADFSSYLSPEFDFSIPASYRGIEAVASEDFKTIVVVVAGISELTKYIQMIFTLTEDSNVPGKYNVVDVFKTDPITVSDNFIQNYVGYLMNSVYLSKDSLSLAVTNNAIGKTENLNIPTIAYYIRPDTTSAFDLNEELFFDNQTDFSSTSLSEVYIFAYSSSDLLTVGTQGFGSGILTIYDYNPTQSVFDLKQTINLPKINDIQYDPISCIFSEDKLNLFCICQDITFTNDDTVIHLYSRSDLSSDFELIKTVNGADLIPTYTDQEYLLNFSNYISINNTKNKLISYTFSALRIIDYNLQIETKKIAEIIDDNKITSLNVWSAEKIDSELNNTKDLIQTQLSQNSGEFQKVLTQDNSGYGYVVKSLQDPQNPSMLGSNAIILADKSNATGRSSFVTGSINSATGDYSSASGSYTQATGLNSHAEGYTTKAQGDYSHAEGSKNTASGKYSHVEGYLTSASGQAAHAEGSSTVASGHFSHAEGNGSQATGYASHAEGENTQATGEFSHAEGRESVASGDHSHAGGNKSQAKGIYSYSMGDRAVASGHASWAFGEKVYASGDYAHAEGNNNYASGLFSHAEGFGSEASGKGSHAEGGSFASGEYAHAEGGNTQASGYYSHTEGESTSTSIDATYAHAEGYGTLAINEAQHVAGKYNIGTSPDTIHETGIGTSTKNKKNAFEIYLDGTLTAPEATINLINSRGNRTLVTKEYVDSSIAASNSNTGSNSLSDLQDVDSATTNAVPDDFMLLSAGGYWTGTSLSDAASKIMLSDIGDVDSATVNGAPDDFILISAGGYWIGTNIPDLMSKARLSDIGDVTDAAGAAFDGSLLVADGHGNWNNIESSLYAKDYITLSDLKGVDEATVGAPNEGDALVYQNGYWVASSINTSNQSGITDVSDGHLYVRTSGQWNRILGSGIYNKVYNGTFVKDIDTLPIGYIRTSKNYIITASYLDNWDKQSVISVFSKASTQPLTVINTGIVNNRDVPSPRTIGINDSIFIYYDTSAPEVPDFKITSVNDLTQSYYLSGILPQGYAYSDQVTDPETSTLFVDNNRIYILGKNNNVYEISADGKTFIYENTLTEPGQDNITIDNIFGNDNFVFVFNKYKSYVYIYKRDISTNGNNSLVFYQKINTKLDINTNFAKVLDISMNDKYLLLKVLNLSDNKYYGALYSVPDSSISNSVSYIKTINITYTNAHYNFMLMNGMENENIVYVPQDNSRTIKKYNITNDSSDTLTTFDNNTNGFYVYVSENNENIILSVDSYDPVQDAPMFGMYFYQEEKSKVQQWVDDEIDLKISQNTSNQQSSSVIKVLQSLPAASLDWFEKQVYIINDGSIYLCVANTETPTSDADCFWIQI